MRKQTMRIAFAFVVLAGVAGAARADEAGTCVATVDPATGTVLTRAEGGCSTSSTSSSQPDHSAANKAAERALFARIDAENTQRAKEKARERERRDSNIRGVSAAKRKQWKRAIELFEGALAKYPDDRLITANLAQARLELAAEQAGRSFDGGGQHGPAKTQPEKPRDHAAQIAAEQEKIRRAERLYLHKHSVKLTAPPSPLATTEREPVGTALSDPEPADPSVHGFFGGVFELFAEHAKNEAAETADEMIDVTTSTGMWLRVQRNVAEQYLTVPDKILDIVVTGDVNEALVLADKVAIRIVDFGSAPTQLLQRIVGAGEQAKQEVAAWTAEQVTEWMTGLANRGIVSLATGLGARVSPGQREHVRSVAATVLNLQTDVPQLVKAWAVK